MSTLTSSNPSAIIDGFSSLMPRVFIAQTTAVSSAIIATGFWQGYGAGSRGSNPVGMQLGDVLMHIASTGSATPGRVTMHSVIGSTSNVASTSLSSGYNAAYDVTVASAT
jgi:hypothetical protein